MKKTFFYSLFIILSCFMITGCDSNFIADGAAEYHHVFPRQFSNQFAEKGIDVDDFTIKLTKKDHRGMGKGLQYVPTNWNKEWEQWLQENPNFSQEDLEKQAIKMLRAAGCRGILAFYNYNSKKLSGATLAGSASVFVCSNNWFLNLCGKIGYWLLSVLKGSTLGGQILAFLAAVGSAVLGFLGIKAEQPVAVGVGIIVIIGAILAIIGLIIFVHWLFVGVLSAVGVLGAGGFLGAVDN